MSSKHVKRAQRPLFREILVSVAFAFVFVYMLIHTSGYLEPKKREFLLSYAKQSSQRTETITLPRATIYDRNGTPLAVSSETFILGIDAKLYENNYSNAVSLAQVTGLDPQNIIARVTLDPHSQFISIKRKLTPTIAKQIRGFKIPGISLQKQYKRFYPAAETTAQVVGITDTNEKGIGGIELAFDKQLTSKPGKHNILVSASGRVIEHPEVIQPAVPGTPVHLSIDLRLQNFAYELLQKKVDKVGAESGSVLMLNARTGEALVVANYPANNPNYREVFDLRLSKNRIFVDRIEPGSTIKPLLVAAVIANKKWDMNKPVPLPKKGSFKTDAFIIRDTRNYGKEISVRDILVKSSNIGAATLGLKLGAKKLIESYINYGFTNTTGSGFPGEVIGKLQLSGKISKSKNVTLSYGYGFSVSLAQLARAYLALANNGRIVPIHLTRDSVSKVDLSEQVLDEEVAMQVRHLLIGVSQSGGTAPNTAISGYTVAGKTGTTHLHEDGGYSTNKYHALFVGMAPARRPELIIAVIVRLPKGDNYYGSESAAPIFRDLMSNSLRILRIHPET